MLSGLARCARLFDSKGEKQMNKRFIFLLLAAGLGYGLSLPAIANAQESELTPEEEAARDAARRMRPTFFEEERKPRFGFGDFVRSALDGEQNAFADPAKISGFSTNLLSNTLTTGINGTITINNLNPQSSGFLQSGQFVGNGTQINFTNINRQSDPRLGQATVNGTVNGQPISPFTADYNAGYSENNVTATGAALFTNLENPQQSILIQLLETNIQGYDDNTPLTGPASLSIGLPTDR